VFEVLADLFPIHWESAETHEYSQTKFLLPDANNIRLLDAHLRAVVAHLDSPEKWQYFKQQGLQGCAEVLSAMAKNCEVVWRKHPVNAWQQVWPDPQPYCDLLIAVLGEFGLGTSVARSCVTDVLCTPMFTFYYLICIRFLQVNAVKC